MRGPNNNYERTRDLNNIYYHNDPTLRDSIHDFRAFRLADQD